MKSYQLNTSYIKLLRTSTKGKNEKCLSREELARELGVGMQTIVNLECKPKHHPSIITCKRLCEFFNVSLDSIITTS